MAPEGQKRPQMTRRNNNRRLTQMAQMKINTKYAKLTNYTKKKRQALKKINHKSTEGTEALKKEKD